MRIKYKVYKNSILATIVSATSSVIGASCIFGAVMGVLAREFGVAIPCIVAAIAFLLGGAALAELINKYETNVKWWKTAIVKSGLEAEMRRSEGLCLKAYFANPCQWTLNKIRSLNPSAAMYIQQNHHVTK